MMANTVTVVGTNKAFIWFSALGILSKIHNLHDYKQVQITNYNTLLMNSKVNILQ